MTANATAITSLSVGNNSVNTSVTAAAIAINGNSIYPSTNGFRRNRVINGSMVIDQRNSGASGTTNGYTIDRWAYNGSQASKGTWGQNLNSVATPVGFPNYLGFQSSSAYTLLAADTFAFYQPIEGFNFADLGFGTASAQTVTISFVVYSSLTGTFGGTLKNVASTRSYPFAYSIPTANTWTSIAITIPGDTSGTWVGSTNAGSAFVQFGLGNGSTYSGTAGAWSSSNFVSATGAVSVVSTNGATFYVTGVQLEAGSVATPFEKLPYSETLILCQRYYSIINNNLQSGAVGYALATAYFPVTMRTTPSLTTISSGVQVNATFNGAGSVTNNSLYFQIITSSAGGYIVNFSIALSAEI
jgi:hypothetical protein